MKDNWNAQLYDRKHSFVSAYGSKLIDLLAPQKGESILDLGCGTGDLTKKLFDSGVKVVGVDKSENMIRTAKEKYPTIPFIVQDVTELSYKNEFEAVFSNAVLHWVKPAKQALEQIYQALKKGGRFVAEFGGKGNVHTIINEIICQRINAGYPFEQENFPWYYPSIGEYTSLMEDVGFHVTFAHHYSRPTVLEGESGLRNWIVMFGSSLLTDIPEKEKAEIITKVEQNLKASLYDEKQKSWIADYKRLRVIGIK